MSFHKNLRGADLHAPSNELVENNTLTVISELKVVSLNGMGLNYPQVIPCNPTVTTAFGIVQKDILVSKPGYITVLGFMFMIDTSAWGPGTPLYANASGNLSTAALGTVVAFVVKQHATDGVLYVTAGTAFSDPGTGGVPWDVNGNPGLDPVLNFLGTLDSVPLNFRTNNVQRAIVDANGRFGVGTATPQGIVDYKGHSSANASGVQLDTFYVETSDLLYNTAITIPIDDPSTVKITIEVTGRQTDGANRASFTRSGVWYREASNVLVQGAWQSDFTQKSDNAMNIQYIVNPTSITFRVKAASATTTRWTGNIKVQRVF